MKNTQVSKITEILLQAGATDVVMVGGCVRDFLLDVSSKDIDIEVYGLTYPQMAKALQGTFRVNQVGASFNVLKVGADIDLAIPRRDSKIGAGHKSFDVQSDPNMNFTEAASRRDFTINAIGMRADGTLLDPWGGADDLKRKILRAPTEAFCEDPLRVLRGMQFAARFGFDMDEKTIDLCRRVLPEFGTLSEERVYMEWFKWASKGKYPEKGLKLLQQTGWLSCFPELAILEQTPQNPLKHPEGNVFIHTMDVCKAAAEIADQEHLSQHDRVILLFAALCHDFGKAVTTIRDSQGQWICPDHASAGEPIARRFLEKMKPPLWLIDNVVPLVKLHMIHKTVNSSHSFNPTAENQLTGNLPSNTSGTSSVSDKFLRHLSVELKDSSIRMWNLLVSADYRALGKLKPGETKFPDWLKRAEQLGIVEKKPEPILLGRHLMEYGIAPGPAMGDLLAQAWNAQLDGIFTDLPCALEWLKKQTD